MGRIGNYAAIFVGSWLAAAVLAPAQAADPAFQSWLEEVWPQAQALGVSRATFDAATRGIEPDLTLPDLDLPGRQAPRRERPMSWSLSIGRIAGTAVRIHITFLLFLIWIWFANYETGGTTALREHAGVRVQADHLIK